MLAEKGECVRRRDVGPGAVRQDMTLLSVGVGG